MSGTNEKSPPFTNFIRVLYHVLYVLLVYISVILSILSEHFAPGG